ncbi:MAG: hypothetical protein P8Z00_17215 [Anaerolineales bacterium]|jgi:hypothetical protein
MRNSVKVVLPRLFIPLILLTIACQALLPGYRSTPTPLATATLETPLALAPTAQPLATPFPLPATGFSVHLHPDGPLYVGDQVSLEVIPPDGRAMNGHSLRVEADGTETIGVAKFAPFGMGERIQATLEWAWDTSHLQAGMHMLKFTILPGGQTWQMPVNLLPKDQVPPPEPGAHWASATSQCCVLYYITGTAAERDLEKLKTMADAQARDVAQRFGAEFNRPIPVVFIPRVLGQGGFTSNEIAISYVDQDYAGDNPAMILHHEMVHWMDAHLGGDLRPTLLVEGLAVYLTGGHYKPEALMPRAAALLSPSFGCTPVEPDLSPPGDLTNPCGLGGYLPLRPLIDNFYTSQHEISYLEAGALIDFMVKTWGWQPFSSFYRDIHAGKRESQSVAMDRALQVHFGLTLDELEARFIQALRAEPVTASQVDDLQLTVDYYDSVRRYQRLLDPSAYFLYAWLPEPAKMRERGIVADFLRHPDTPMNRSLETLLFSANQALLAKEYPLTYRLLNSINQVLDRVPAEPVHALSGN